MKKKIIKIIILTLLFFLTTANSNQICNKEKQHKKKLTKNFTKVTQLNISIKLTNPKSFLLQIKKIKSSNSPLYLKNKNIYKSIEKWIQNSLNINQLNKYGIDLFQMKGVDNYGNIKISGYYTPVIKARKSKKGEFKYPIYSMPFNFRYNGSLPKRKDIYNGILNKKYILAYTNSLLNNFIMDIQGSGFINYEDNKPLTFFSYSGNNGWPYTSIGKILINRGDIKKNNMSMQSIKYWCKKHTKKEIQKLLEKNESFVFFKPTQKKQVRGSSAVPLIEKTSVAVDNSLIKQGSVILTKIPILNENGLFMNKYEMRLLIALDVGGAIKGQHFDIYQGIGEKPGLLAGFYNHYGYAWVLKKN